MLGFDFVTLGACEPRAGKAGPTSRILDFTCLRRYVALSGYGLFVSLLRRRDVAGVCDRCSSSRCVKSSVRGLMDVTVCRDVG